MNYFEYNAGSKHRFVPCETDVVEFDPAEFTGFTAVATPIIFHAGPDLKLRASLADMLNQAKQVAP